MSKLTYYANIVYRTCIFIASLNHFLTVCSITNFNMANDLEAKIIKQIEYYFGDINLPRDKFLQEKIKEDEGWVPLETLLTFKRLAALSTDKEVIAKAIEKSEDKIAVVSEDHKKIRRNPEKPLPELNDERRKELMNKTAYVKGFPLDEDFDKIVSFFELYGPIASCNKRCTKDHKFKGSCFVIFKDVESCKKFIDLESIKYGETELIKKFQKDYFNDKKKEIEERKKNKKENKSKSDEKSEKKLEFPKGAVLHFSGIEQGQTLTREELKDKVKEIGDTEVQFVDFSKGDLEGYLRFPAENNAVEFFNKVTDATLEVSECKLKLKVLEGEEEEEYLKKSSDAILEFRKKQKMGGRNNRKRKGNFGGYNKDSKSKKVD
ncbi:la protein homolog [Diorhabda carinulata]|uniref:la protein homolog n=1 Tax=Diorhabda carinulata TaxID=1163345 RepID=UPI0025A1AA94|nr:la protein homolog [Diorhabda carinulata]